ncbi:formate dehydrogenase accessory protein FdhE [Alteribacter natronophilus]|uniref:formate dehydrogenase accessory protein FdhE n=1 Tax=Alteribacter natronophilus TaxID=2583810 RepID=UPI00110E5949|nr:formate dehydrogenase accessory protein FdhE [Alteribacter natronophilus]TMW71810.1 formate dehydrogenase accessory protein FdhE [Alteribacter natronophilus]
MNSSMISDEYVQLYRSIADVQIKVRGRAEGIWQESDLPDEDLIDPEFPVIGQLESPPVTAGAFAEALELIAAEMKEGMTELAEDFGRCISLIHDGTSSYQWMKEALRYNPAYFQDVSDQNGIAPWLPHFLAEQALRPFLQVLSEKAAPLLGNMNTGGVCPCCGEPVRLKVEAAHNKERFLCPRCETAWHRSASGCAHCGEKEEGAVIRLTVKEEPGSELEVCERCRQFVKVIKEQSGEDRAAILDLMTIHLDYIAREEGYETGETD